MNKKLLILYILLSGCNYNVSQDNSQAVLNSFKNTSIKIDKLYSLDNSNAYCSIVNHVVLINKIETYPENILPSDKYGTGVCIAAGEVPAEIAGSKKYGYIFLTAAHVVRPTTNNGVVSVTQNFVFESFQVDDTGLVISKIIAADSDNFIVKILHPSSDIALVFVWTENNLYVTPAALGTPGNLKVGEAVWSVGMPEIPTPTLKYGVVSGFNIEKEVVLDMNVSPGCSGAGIFNSQGHLVGIVYAYYRIGMGVAIDLEQVYNLLKQADLVLP